MALKKKELLQINSRSNYEGSFRKNFEKRNCGRHWKNPERTPKEIMEELSGKVSKKPKEDMLEIAVSARNHGKNSELFTF